MTSKRSEGEWQGLVNEVSLHYMNRGWGPEGKCVSFSHLVGMILEK